jgi:hypothetical protein
LLARYTQYAVPLPVIVSAGWVRASFGLPSPVTPAATNFPTRRWVHHEEERWISDTGAILRWEDLRDPVLIREGVQ